MWSMENYLPDATKWSNCRHLYHWKLKIKTLNNTDSEVFLIKLALQRLRIQHFVKWRRETGIEVKF